MSDLESAHKFVTLESIFYPELVPYYRRRIDAWISKERRAIERSKRPVTVAKFLARHGGGYLLAKETLEECAATCEPPRRRKDLFRILDSWVAARDKPNGPEPGSINIYSRWFLPWSLEILGPTAFHHYRKRNPQGALAIEEWIGKLASEWDARLREKNLGGGLAAQMGAGIARAIVSFARSLGVYEQPSLLHRDQPSQG
ncbi:MAG TPA: hypothetical protein VNK67_03210 [Burkholderiales bacterium]|nr:hypothetical protein [Burkholderiales bacterium]